MKSLSLSNHVVFGRQAFGRRFILNQRGKSLVLGNKGLPIKSEPDMAVFFTHRGFMALMLWFASCQRFSLHYLLFSRRSPYNQLYSAAVTLLSLVNTDIHQYPISFSWSSALYPPPPPHYHDHYHYRHSKEIWCCCYSRV